MFNTLMTLSLHVKSIAIVHALIKSASDKPESVSFVRYFSAYLNIIFKAVSLNFQFNAMRPKAIFLPKIFSMSLS